MGKITGADIEQIRKHFNRLDSVNDGKIILNDIIS